MSQQYYLVTLDDLEGNALCTEHIWYVWLRLYHCIDQERLTIVVDAS